MIKRLGGTQKHSQLSSCYPQFQKRYEDLRLWIRNIPDFELDMSTLKVDDELFAVDGDRGLILGVETVTEEPGQNARFSNAKITPATN
jgi:hypothetical protein